MSEYISLVSEELTIFPATRLALMIRRREVSPVEVVEAHLRRIEKVNSMLNAVVTVAPDALEHARELEERVARGEETGALAGVPVTVKDTFEVRGLRTTFGSRLFAENVPRQDASAVSRLREAGAIILGKTNASEFALDYTADNTVFGRTNNPHDFERTPGGSSGGCAAAVAACLAPASLGSDLVGSLRIPAHFCGVAGLRPMAKSLESLGHLPPFAAPFSLAASAGPIARRVEDLLLLDSALRAGGVSQMESALETGGINEVKKWLSGIAASWYTDDGVTPVTEETRRAVETAARALETVGMRVAEQSPPHAGRATEMWLALFSGATQTFVSRIYEGREELAGSAARAILERAARPHQNQPAEFLDAMRVRHGRRDDLLRWLEKSPVVVSPVGAVPAIRHDAGNKLAVGEREVGKFRAFGFAQFCNVFDLPAVCVPVGVSSEGLPIGVQITGHPSAEQLVHAAALVVEEATGGWRGVPENLSKTRVNPIYSKVTSDK